MSYNEDSTSCAQTYGLTAQVLARLAGLGRTFGLTLSQRRARNAGLNRSTITKSGFEGRAETTDVDNIEESFLAVIESSKINIDQSSYVHSVIQPRGSWANACEVNLLPEQWL